MSRRDDAPSALNNIDLITFSIYLALIGVGWLMVYTVNHEEVQGIGPLEFLGTIVGKQSIWILLSLGVFFFILLIDWKFWQTFAYLIYAISMVLLVGVLFFGATIKGASSWYVFGGFSFQPSELAKFGTCLAISSYLSSYNTSLKNFQSQVIAVSLFVVPVLLILLQPDAGSALVFLSLFILLFREGLSSNYYLIAVAAGTVLVLGLIYSPFIVILGMLLTALLIIAANMKSSRGYWVSGVLAAAGLIYYLVRADIVSLQVAFFVILAVSILVGIWAGFNRRAQLIRGLTFAIVLGSGIAVAANYAFNNILQSHQQERIKVWLQPEECDPQGALYNVLQSKMAIGSGGWQGKGFLHGTMTKLKYVPELSTDFIFCAIAEEQGFVGSIGLIGLFLVLVIRMTVIAERQRNNFARHYAYAVSGMLFFHFVINIGMTMGLLPIIGIPLPFISQGGSSLLGFTIMIAVLLKLDSNRFKI